MLTSVISKKNEHKSPYKEYGLRAEKLFRDSRVNEVKRENWKIAWSLTRQRRINGDMLKSRGTSKMHGL